MTSPARKIHELATSALDAIRRDDETAIIVRLGIADDALVAIADEAARVEQAAADLIGSMLPAARTSDPATSHAPPRKESVRMRWSSQRAILLRAYEHETALAHGLTDEEAAWLARAEPRSCWWKRCSELRALGLIAQAERDGKPKTRTSSSGEQRIVCELTDAGMRWLAANRP